MIFYLFFDEKESFLMLLRYFSLGTFGILTHICELFEVLSDNVSFFVIPAALQTIFKIYRIAI